MQKNKGRLQSLRSRLGIAGVVLIILIAFVIISVVSYYASGVGIVPTVKADLKAQDSSVFLVVKDGIILAQDWEYMVFDARFAPTTTWFSGPANIEPGANILLASNLDRGTYRVLLRHKPTRNTFFDNRVAIGL